MEYRNQNQAGWNPIELACLEGVAQDAWCCPIPGVCVGLFSESDHRFVTGTSSDEQGRFRLGPVPDGDYRLVAEYSCFCVANTRVRLAQNKRNHDKLLLHMLLEPYVSFFESGFGTLSGKVAYADEGRPACLPRLGLEFESEGRSATVMADEKGDFSACLPPGKYTLSKIEAVGHRLIPVDPKQPLGFTVRNNRPTRYDIRLVPAPAAPKVRP